MKSWMKKLIPEIILLGYHYILAKIAQIYFGNPSKKLTVIGITGTKGKSSSANFVWSILQTGGLKTGLIGTANIRMGEIEEMNKYHMTMPGPFVIQKLLRRMLEENCTHVVMEVTSEGIKQSRHIGIDFNIGVFTNLTPEHLPSHGGSFEKYKQTKGKFFEILSKNKKSISIINADSPHAEYFLSFSVEKKITYSIENNSNYKADNIVATTSGVDFSVNKTTYHLSMLGSFNVWNALPAIIIGEEIGIKSEKIIDGIKNLKIIPGRMEVINEGQDFIVIVDYAHEKESMTALMKTANQMIDRNENKIIVHLGAEGGGRDKAKRPIMGQLVGQYADYVVCGNVDPYEDDPLPIAEDIAVAAEAAGKIRNENLFVILDRREGIIKCLELAKTNDLVLITGKGAEQSIVIAGKSKPWDDRIVVREELQKLKNK